MQLRTMINALSGGKVLEVYLKCTGELTWVDVLSLDRQQMSFQYLVCIEYNIQMKLSTAELYWQPLLNINKGFYNADAFCSHWVQKSCTVISHYPQLLQFCFFLYKATSFSDGEYSVSEGRNVMLYSDSWSFADPLSCIRRAAVLCVFTVHL